MSVANVRISVEEVRKQLTAMVLHFKKRVPKRVLKKAGEVGVQIMKEEAPRGITGRLRESIRYRITDKRVEIFPDIDYAKFVIRGIRSSPGRYVPYLGTAWAGGLELGKRLVRPSKRNPVIGMHPGTVPNPFVDRAARRMRPELDRILRGEAKWR